MYKISQEQILELNIKPLECINWAMQAIMNKKDFILPPKNSIKYNNGNFFNTMPVMLPKLEIFGVKEVSRIIGRKPSIKADFLLFDTKNGEKLAFIEADWITTARTGAVASISAKFLKKSDDFTFGFIGLGETAKSTMTCLVEIFKHNILKVNLLAYKNQHLEFMKKFEQHKNISFKVCNNINELIKLSGTIISAVTHQNSNFANASEYKNGTLIIPIHTLGFQNCDIEFDKIFCDDIGHIRDFKNFNNFKSLAELSNVLNGDILGRENDKQRILAYNIGVASLDLFFAYKILEKMKLLKGGG